MRLNQHRTATRAARVGAACLVGAVAGMAGNASAVDYYWDNPGEGLWSNGLNWDLDTVPQINDTARIANGGTAVIDSSQTNVRTGFATLGPTAGTSGTLRMTGGMLTTNFDIRVGGESSTGGGAGIMQQSGGDIFMNGGNFVIGFGSGGATGTYDLSGGTVKVNSATIYAIGNRGTGTVNQSGGSFYVRGGVGTSASIIQLGRNASTGTGSGTYNLSGGDLTGARTLFGAANSSAAGSVNDFNLSGTGRLVTGASPSSTPTPPIPSTSPAVRSSPTPSISR